MVKLHGRLVVECGRHVGVDEDRPPTGGAHATQESELIVDVVMQTDAENDIENAMVPDVPCVVLHKMQIRQACPGPYIFRVGNVPRPDIDSRGFKPESCKFRRVAALKAAEVNNRPSPPPLRKEQWQERLHAKVVPRLINGRSRGKGIRSVVETNIMGGESDGMLAGHLLSSARAKY